MSGPGSRGGATPAVVLPPGAFEAMGTVVSVRLGASGAHADAAVAAVAAVFARWEARCSLFDPRSELSRVGLGELALLDASADVRDAYALALHWRAATDGAFTPHRGDGLIDLNGVVKALAVEEAGEVLDRAGFAAWAINAGGDVLVAATPSVVAGASGVAGVAGAAPHATAPATAGAPVARVAPSDVTDPGRSVGIVDPADRAALLARIDLDPPRRRAVATSGSAERGDHIWTVPGAGPSPFVQVSVAAADLVTADVLATAIVAGGRASLDGLADRHDIDVLAVAREGGLLATPGWPRRPAGAADAGDDLNRAASRPMRDPVAAEAAR